MEILYEDKNILICKKEPGILSQSDGEEDMVKLASRHCASTCAPLTRLDRNVGGVMLLSKNPEAAKRLSALVGDKDKTIKTYLAAVTGSPDDDRGIMRDLLFKDSRLNKSFVASSMRRGVKDASLEYSVLAREVFENEPVTLLKIRLHTGRTHQIRVQCASRGMPIIGDGKYGSRIKSDAVGLWSASLEFDDPFSKKRIAAKCPPDDTFPWNLFSKQIYGELK